MTRNIAEALGSDPAGLKNIETDTVSVEAKTFERDGETHLILTAIHKSAKWCSAAARLVHRSDGTIDLHTGFAIDRMPYALESDFPAQKDCIDILAQVLEKIGPDAVNQLHQDIEQSLLRVRARWEENAGNGHRVDRLSIYKDYSNILMLAAPSTAIGSRDLVGVEYDTRKQVFGQPWRRPNSRSKLVPITQKLLADETAMSGHEKLLLLSGEETPLLVQAKEAFLNADNRTCGYRSKVAPHPSPDAVAFVYRGFFDRREDTDKISLNVNFASHDTLGVDVSASPCPEEDKKQHIYLRLTMSLAANRLLLLTEGGRIPQKNAFKLSAKWTSKKHPPSQEELLSGLNRLLYEIAQLDPVWPDWVYKVCDAAYDTQHPALHGLDLPPRHQPIVAKLLAESFDDLKVQTDRMIAKHEKTVAKQKSVEALPTEMPDGIVFGDIKTGRLKAWEKAKISGHARVFSVQTTSAPDAKHRKRALVPHFGVLVRRPFTAKQIARLTAYTDPDALRLFPAEMLGDRGRDRLEAAYRVALTLKDEIENPILAGDCTLATLETTDADWTVQWTEIAETEGYAFNAFSVFREMNTGYSPRTLTGVGIGFLTMPQGETVYLRPSFGTEIETLMPPEELKWLREAIDQSFPFEPQKAEAMIEQLEKEWAKLANDYPAALPKDPKT